MTEITVRLKDSWMEPTAATGWDGRHDANVLRAVRMIDEEIKQGKVQCFAFNGRRRDTVLTSVVQCYVEGTKTVQCHVNLSGLSFTTSHYVGQVCIKIDNDIIRLQVLPRLVQPVWRYLLKTAACIFLPNRLRSIGMEAGSEDSEWLLLLMWRNAFERAIKQASVPKTYVWRNSNLRFFKGRLDVARHLHDNLTDESRFRCVYKPLTFNNTINRTIRAVYRVLSNSKLPVKAYLSIAEHDAKLASFGVDNKVVSDQEIDRIVYTRASEPYRPLMNLSKVLLRGYGAGEVENASQGPSYFVDVAEVWENYLLGVMKRRLPEYHFVSPNDENSGEYLFNNARTLRPDFLAYDGEGRLVAVMDAKYKKYDKIGYSASLPHAVSREDLYQMATYLYRYASSRKQCAGIFLTPFSRGGSECLTTANGLPHFMTVCNLALYDFEDGGSLADADSATVKTELAAREADFAERLKGILAKCGATGETSLTN